MRRWILSFASVCLFLFATQVFAQPRVNPQMSEEKSTRFLDVSFSLPNNESFSFSHLPIGLLNSTMTSEATKPVQAELFLRRGFIFFGPWLRYYGEAKNQHLESINSWNEIGITNAHAGLAASVATEFFTPFENYQMIWFKGKLTAQGDPFGRSVTLLTGTNDYSMVEEEKLGTLYEHAFLVDLLFTLKNLRNIRQGIFSGGLQFGRSLYSFKQAEGFPGVSFKPKDHWRWAIKLNIAI